MLLLPNQLLLHVVPLVQLVVLVLLAENKRVKEHTLAAVTNETNKTN
jgi:hypothetical protein